MPRLEPFLRNGAATLEHFNAADRRLLELAFLYVCYHRSVSQLDALIERQENRGGEPLAVPFVEGVIRDLMRCGVREERALRYFALFFKLRRGCHTILHSLAGVCGSMRRLREASWNNIFTHDMRDFEAAPWDRTEDPSTLVLGKTATGKGAVAAAIGRSNLIRYVAERHRFAANFTETVIAIDLSQYAEVLIESGLLGHCKGAFTGAVDRHEGVFESCNAHGAQVHESRHGAVIILGLTRQALEERSRKRPEVASLRS